LALVRLAPLEVEGAQHGNVDTETSQHELDGAKHECGARCTSEVVNEICKLSVVFLFLVRSRVLTDGEDENETRNTDNHASETQTETSQHGKLFRLSHLQLPYTMDWDDYDHEIGRHVCQNQTLEQQDLIHAVSNSLKGPLLGDGVAEEDKDEVEDDSPCNDYAGSNVDCKAQLQLEDAVVEG